MSERIVPTTRVRMKHGHTVSVRNVVSNTMARKNCSMAGVREFCAKKKERLLARITELDKVLSYIDQELAQ